VDFQPNFFEQVTAVAARHPGKALAFFAEWGCRTSSMIRIAALRGASWAEVIDDYIPTQALLLPAEAARGAAEHLATVPDDMSDDGAVRQYLVMEDIPMLVSVPNLVEHLDLQSVSRNGYMGQRRATCYSRVTAVAGPYGDTAVTGLTRVPYYSWWNKRAESCIRADAHSLLWRAVPTPAMLSDLLRVPLWSLESACTEGVNEVSTNFLEAGLVDEETVRGLWFTAYALGILAAGETPPSTGEVPGSRTVALALKSLVPGALRTVLQPAGLALASQALGPVMHAAVRSGYTRLP
jgi:hypothetical protein